MSKEEIQRKAKGSSIWVPTEFKSRLVSLSKRYSIPQWKILLQALSLYETQIRKARTKEELPKVEKVIWYIQKLCMSIGSLKALPSQENVERTKATINQIKERLQVDTGILERAVNDFVSIAKLNNKEHEKIDEATMELNMALKSVLIEIVYKHILKEEGENK
jgi:hypothetical protein